jgi:hypothetical protein
MHRIHRPMQIRFSTNSQRSVLQRDTSEETPDPKCRDIPPHVARTPKPSSVAMTECTKLCSGVQPLRRAAKLGTIGHPDLENQSEYTVGAAEECQTEAVFARVKDCNVHRCSLCLDGDAGIEKCARDYTAPTGPAPHMRKAWSSAIQYG